MLRLVVELRVVRRRVFREVLGVLGLRGVIWPVLGGHPVFQRKVVGVVLALHRLGDRARRGVVVRLPERVRSGLILYRRGVPTLRVVLLLKEARPPGGEVVRRGLHVAVVAAEGLELLVLRFDDAPVLVLVHVVLPAAAAAPGVRALRLLNVSCAPRERAEELARSRSVPRGVPRCQRSVDDLAGGDCGAAGLCVGITSLSFALAVTNTRTDRQGGCEGSTRKSDKHKNGQVLDLHGRYVTSACVSQQRAFEMTNGAAYRRIKTKV